MRIPDSDFPLHDLFQNNWQPVSSRELSPQRAPAIDHPPNPEIDPRDAHFNANNVNLPASAFLMMGGGGGVGWPTSHRRKTRGNIVWSQFGLELKESHDFPLLSPRFFQKMSKFLNPENFNIFDRRLLNFLQFLNLILNIVRNNPGELVTTNSAHPNL